MQNRPIYPEIWPLRTTLHRDQYRGSYRYLDLYPTNDGFSQRRAADLEISFRRSSKFFSSPFLSRDDRSNQISKRAVEYFFQDIKTLPFFFFFHKNRKFFYTSGSRGDQDPQKKSSAVSSWEIRYRNYFQKFIFITSTDCPRDRQNLEESIIDLTNWTIHRNVL